MAAVVAGQGLKPAPQALGAVDTSLGLLATFQKHFKDSAAWRGAYKASPQSACSMAARGSLCAAAGLAGSDAYATLLMATSPSRYSSLDAGRLLMSAPQDQGECSMCTAFAVVAAAEAAVASVMQVDVRDAGQLSVQDEAFCAPDKPRSCHASSSMQDMVEQLRRPAPLLLRRCLPWAPDLRDEKDQEALCQWPRACADGGLAAKGKFSFVPINMPWAAQRHIREYGAVVTRFDIYSDFKPFFQKTANMRKVYAPSPGAVPVEPHAIVLVGYDNDQGYWLARNSWGPEWADGGYFRVKYGVANILAPDDTFGIIWRPTAPLVKPALPLGPVPAKARLGCHTYKTVTGDFLSRVAFRAGIEVATLLHDNLGTIDDPGALLKEGTTLLVCSGGGDSSGSRSSSGGGGGGGSSGGGTTTSTSGGSGSGSGTSTTSGGGRGDSTGVGSNSSIIITISRGSNAGGGGGGDRGNGDGATSTASQLRALLAAKSAFDKAGMLSDSWTEAAGANGGYCNFPGVACDASKNVVSIKLSGGLNPSGAFGGTLPSASVLEGLPKLRNISLTSRQISGPLPPDWGRLSQMEGIGLGQNSLEGPIPAEWGNMRRLKALVLTDNRLTGTLPPSLGTAWEAMEDLGLAVNGFSGFFPAAWGRMGQLRSLLLATNKLIGTLPSSTWPAMEFLTLGNNGFVGSIPLDWRLMGHLKQLNIGKNKLSGTLPPSLGVSWPAMEVLTLSDNEFIGSIPLEWGRMGRIKWLELSKNKLTGTLPPSLGASWPAMEALTLSDNAFSGSIPPEWGRMGHIKWLGLSGNKLTGTLPPSFGASWPAMQHLILSNNDFVGSIPPEWGRMGQLEQLSLWSNSRLEGCLPPGLEKFAGQQDTCSDTALICRVCT